MITKMPGQYNLHTSEGHKDVKQTSEANKIRNLSTNLASCCVYKRLAYMYLLHNDSRVLMRILNFLLVL